MNYFHTIADFVNLNLYPDISSSRYDIDNVGGSSIRMIKFPFTYEPGPEDLTWQPFFEGALSYMKAHSSYRNIEKLIG